jgi:dephospho-CoA kinase
LVTADDNIRIKRVMDRDKKTYREIEAIMQKQMPEKDKIKKQILLLKIIRILKL